MSIEPTKTLQHMKRATRKKGSLILSDGSKYDGLLFGAEKSISGEVVFNTGMTGYTESLSDPSYEGQILVATYPLQGNYGLPSLSTIQGDLPKYYESKKLHPKAFIVHNYCEGYSHWNAAQSLEDGMKEAGMVGLTGIDTRALTEKLRTSGSMLGKIIPQDAEDPGFMEYDNINLVDQVSVKKIIEYDGGSKPIVLVDCGCKLNIIRELRKRDLHVIQVPWDHDFTSMDVEGVFISNGPGNPNLCSATVEHVKKAIAANVPTTGICMGNQIMALAIGAKVEKMKYGHRSHNQPVRMEGTNKCFITSQNHGFAVNDTDLPDGWRTYFSNLNDGTNEGLIHDSGKFFSVQFHPEACGGPTDTTFIFDDFVRLLN